jgi:VanZ family protein
MTSLLSPSTTQYRWLAVLWTLGIVVACSIPAASLSPIEPALSADKAIHFGLFAVFGGLWMRALCPPDAAGPICRRGLYLLGAGSLFAVGTEVYQHLMPLQRRGDPYDALADGAGLLVAVVAYVLYLRSRAVPDRSG